jgi:alpha-glucosidase
VPWSGESPPFGFSPEGVATWLPQPADWGSLTAQAQEGVAGSTLELYRSALALRRSEPALAGRLMRWVEGSDDLLVLERGAGSDRVQCVVNFGSVPEELPSGRVLLSSGDLTPEGQLPAEMTAWIRPV